MKANIGGLDRAIRIIVGLSLIAAGIFIVNAGFWPVLLILVGAVIFLTGILRFCALYSICEIDTSGSDAVKN